MSDINEIARKKITAAVEAYKARLLDGIVKLAVLPENVAKRETLVHQYQIADDVGKTIAAEVFKGT